MDSVVVFVLSFLICGFVHYFISATRRRKMDLKKEFGVDKRREIEGVWFDDEFEGDTKCLIARIGNPTYQKEFQRIAKPHKRALRKGTLNDDVAENLLTRAMANSILLDWVDMYENGKKLLYSSDEAFRVMKEYKDFREIVSDVANEIEAFRLEEEKEAEKNLKKS